MDHRQFGEGGGLRGRGGRRRPRQQQESDDDDNDDDHREEETAVMEAIHPSAAAAASHPSTTICRMGYHIAGESNHVRSINRNDSDNQNHNHRNRQSNAFVDERQFSFSGASTSTTTEDETQVSSSRAFSTRDSAGTYSLSIGGTSSGGGANNNNSGLFSIVDIEDCYNHDGIPTVGEFDIINLTTSSELIDVVVVDAYGDEGDGHEGGLDGSNNNIQDCDHESGNHQDRTSTEINQGDGWNSSGAGAASSVVVTTTTTEVVLVRAKRVTNRPILMVLGVVLAIAIVAMAIVSMTVFLRNHDQASNSAPTSTMFPPHHDSSPTSTSPNSTNNMMQPDHYNEDSSSPKKNSTYYWVPVGSPIYGSHYLGQSQLGSAVALSDDGSVLVAAELSRGMRVYRWTTSMTKKKNATNNVHDDGDDHIIYPASDNWQQLGNISGMRHSESRIRTSVSMNKNGTIIAMGSGLLGGDTFGNVVVFQFLSINETWLQLGQNLTSDAPGVGFGHDISLSDDGMTLAVGIIEDDNENGNNAGKVQVFTLVNGTHWERLGQDMLGDGPNDNLGCSVTLSGDGKRVAFGSLHAISNSGKNRRTGHAQVYDFDGMWWNQVGQPLYGIIDGEEHGYSIDLSSDGSILAVGSRNPSGGEAGRVRVYELNANVDGEDSISWKPMGNDILGESPSDRFGSAVSLSNDGRTLAVGADGATNGEGDLAAGQVLVFRFEENDWVQFGQSIQGEHAIDRRGLGAALSGDGSMLAVGAPMVSNTSRNQGMVQTFLAVEGKDME